MKPHHLVRPLLDFLLPPICLACGNLDSTGELRLGLCGSCLEDLVPVGATACSGCGLEPAGGEPTAAWRCPACRLDPPPWRRLLSGWRYQPPLDHVVRGLKFGRLDYLGGQIAEALHRRFGRELSTVDMVAAVPLHWRRRLHRGYNQAEEIARPLARLMGRPLRHPLRRRRATAPQARLARADRVANLEGTFCPASTWLRANPGKETHVLLVDDVLTTGSTLRVAARSLLQRSSVQLTVMTAGRTFPDWR